MEENSLLYDNCLSFLNQVAEYFNSKRLKAWLFSSFCSIIVSVNVNLIASLATYDHFESDLLIGSMISLITQPIYMWYAIYVEYKDEEPEYLLGMPLVIYGLTLIPILVAIITSETVDWIDTW